MLHNTSHDIEIVKIHVCEVKTTKLVLMNIWEETDKADFDRL